MIRYIIYPIIILMLTIACSDSVSGIRNEDIYDIEDIYTGDIPTRDYGYLDYGVEEEEDIIDMDYTIRDADPKNPDNKNIDSDCDGLSDFEEFSIIYAGGKKTDPMNPDSDGDGITDGVEAGRVSSVDPLCKRYFRGDADPSTITNPTSVDSDCDGIPDGAEDKNKNGKRDQDETDAADPDTDRDGLTDGVELGLIEPADRDLCRNFIADSDPNTVTDPLNPDTDGDGIMDGAEDANQNGRFEEGELNPNDGNDGKGAAHNACSTENLITINFFNIKDADALLALADEYRDIPPDINISKLTLNGSEKGFIFVHKDKGVGGFLIEKKSEGADVIEEEKIIRGDTPCKVPSGYLQKIDCLSNPITQTFITWDGYPAIVANYDYGRGEEDDLKGRLNLIAKAFLGDIVDGLFADGVEKGGGHSADWKLEIEIIRRQNNRSIVVGSLVSSDKFSSDPLLKILRGDITNGSAIAQIGDTTGVQCDIKNSGNPIVDFIWVVDDSCSMAPYQKAVNLAATSFVDKLQNSQVDYRIAAITTGYWQKTLKNSSTPTKNYGKVFGFTKDLDEFKSWFKQPCNLSDKSCIGDAQCTGTEKGVESLYDALLNPKNNAIPLLPTPGQGEPADTNRIRFGAKVVVIFLSDAGDQSNREGEYVNGNPPSDANDGPWWDKNLPTWPVIFDEISNRKDIDGLIANAIICSTNDCGGETKNPSLYDILVQRTNGVQGLIKDNASIDATMQAIVDSAIAATGISLSKSPISASIKVVQENPPANCPQPTPRDPINGFDYDGVFQRISFFGDCRPEKPGNKIAVSYRYWIDRDRPIKDCGECEKPFKCNTETGRCECPPDCDGNKPSENYVCDQNSCSWVCPSECGGACSLYFVCKNDDCSCVCDENFTCNIGYRPDPVNCTCKCSAEELKCDETHEADLNNCQCVCKEDCGGCPDGFVCQPSLCFCERKPL